MHEDLFNQWGPPVDQAWFLLPPVHPPVPPLTSFIVQAGHAELPAQIFTTILLK